MSGYKHADAIVMPGRGPASEGGLQLRGATRERTGGGAHSIALFERGSGSGSHPGDEQPGAKPEEWVEHRRALSPVEEEADGVLPPPPLSEAALLMGEMLSPDAQFRLEGSYTPEQLRVLRERLRQEGRKGLRLEYLDGEVYVTTTALARHVTAVVNLMVALVLVMRRQELGQVLTDFTNFLGHHDELVPDLLVVLKQDLPRLTEKGLLGPATIVAEVLSPSTAHLDRGLKLRTYLAAGVQEYWLVDPVKREVHVYTPAHVGKSWRAPHQIFREQMLLTTPYVPGLSLPLEGVFERSYVHVDPVAADLARMLEAQVKQAQEAAVQARDAAIQAQELALETVEALKEEKAVRVALTQALTEAEAQRAAEAMRAQEALERAEAHARALADTEAQRAAEATRAQEALERAEAQRAAEATRAQEALERAEAQRAAEATRAKEALEQAEAQRAAEATRAQEALERAEAQRAAEATRAKEALERAEAQRAAEATRAKEALERAEAHARALAEAEAQRAAEATRAKEALERAEAFARALAEAEAQRAAEALRIHENEQRLLSVLAELEQLRKSNLS